MHMTYPKLLIYSKNIMISGLNLSSKHKSGMKKLK